MVPFGVELGGRFSLRLAAARVTTIFCVCGRETLFTLVGADEFYYKLNFIIALNGSIEVYEFCVRVIPNDIPED